MWHDSNLVGNGRWCSCCYPAGRPVLGPEGNPVEVHRRGCNECSGKGRIPFTAEEIVAATVEENRRWRKRRDAA